MWPHVYVICACLVFLSVGDLFVSTKPLHVSVFFHDHLQGVIRCALCCYCTTNERTQPTLRTSTAPTHTLRNSSQADRQQTRTPNTHTGKSGLLQIKCLTFHILNIMNIVEIILRNCCITDDIHMRPHTAQ